MINNDILKTIILCRHWQHVRALHHWDSLPGKKSKGNASGFFSNFCDDIQQVTLKTCENDINIELTCIDKIFFPANCQIYRYTIYCGIPN